MSLNTQPTNMKNISYDVAKTYNNTDIYGIDTQTSKNAIPVTPEMLQDAVRELEAIRVFAGVDLIVNHLWQRYPVERHCATLRNEVVNKLRCAVCVGLIETHGEDKYCMPTLRKEANTNKTALSAFWGLYFNRPRR